MLLLLLFLLTCSRNCNLFRQIVVRITFSLLILVTVGNPSTSCYQFLVSLAIKLHTTLMSRYFNPELYTNNKKSWQFERMFLLVNQACTAVSMRRQCEVLRIGVKRRHTGKGLPPARCETVNVSYISYK